MTLKRTWIQRGRSLIAKLISFGRWRCAFGAFGWGSILRRPDMLTGLRGIAIGRRVSILKGARLEAFDVQKGQAPRLSIGDGTSIQMYFHCGAAERVSIGENVLIAGRVYVSDHDHAFDDPAVPPIKAPLRTAPVVIEREAWIGEGAVILKGVTIGQRAVIGANAVVTKDVPPWSVAVGVPAKVIKTFGAR